MPQQHQPHLTEYAPPVMRSPSPASSIGTAYDMDQTNPGDYDLDQREFERRCEAQLQLKMPTAAEVEAQRSPLLPRSDDPEEVQANYEQVMRSLRWEVQQLQENELFEQILLRGSQIGAEIQPSTENVDTILKSIMPPPGTAMNAVTLAFPGEDVVMGNQVRSPSKPKGKNVLLGLGLTLSSPPMDTDVEKGNDEPILDGPWFRKANRKPMVLPNGKRIG